MPTLPEESIRILSAIAAPFVRVPKAKYPAVFPDVALSLPDFIVAVVDQEFPVYFAPKPILPPISAAIVSLAKIVNCALDPVRARLGPSMTASPTVFELAE